MYVCKVMLYIWTIIVVHNVMLFVDKYLWRITVSCVLSLLHKVMVLHNREYLDLSGVCRFGMLACRVCV